jgi:membrane associated rhomboid family serine protease
VRFFFWYVACGLAATTAQTIATLHWGSAHETSIPNIGASGAIAGVLGAYFLLLPTARVLTIIFFFLVEVPAFLVLGAWFAFQLWEANLSLTHPQASGGVALFAHIGGFVFGLATVRFLVVRRPLAPRY